MPLRLRTVRGRGAIDRLLAVTEPLEPRASIVNGMLLCTRGRERRVVVAEHEDGRIAGIAVTAQECLDRWTATVLLLDDAAAPTLAPSLDRGPARELVGLAGDVEPVLPHLRRARNVIRMPWNAIAAPIPPLPEWLVGDLEGEGRVATRRDVRAVARLYDAYEFQGPPTRIQLRRQLRRALRRGMPALVVETDGKIVAANRIGLRTRRYALWTDATVLPEYRRRRLMWILTRDCWALTADLGLGFIGTSAPSNPAPEEYAERAMEDIDITRDEWLTVPLQATVRFRGQGKLRTAFAVMAGRRRRRPVTPVGD